MDMFCLKSVCVTIILIVMHVARSSSLATCQHLQNCTCSATSFNCTWTTFTLLPNKLPTQIQHFSIKHGELKIIETQKLYFMSKLKSIDFSYNQIENIQPDTFTYITELETIKLHSNRLRMLWNGLFSSLMHLKILILSDNKLISLQGVLDGLTSLEVLTVAGNQLSTVTSDMFRDLKNLHRLELNDNKITTLEPNMFRWNPKLMLLGIGSNPISSMDGVFSYDSMLTYLNMTDCQLTRIPPDLPQTLQHLKLSKNNISEVYKSDVNNYRQLHAIIIEENNLTYVEPGSFEHMTQLVNVFLFVNNLETFPGPFPQNVKNIYLDDNQIRQIPKDSLAPGTELSILSLRGNQLDSFSGYMFQDPPHIEDLHLERNPIQILKDNIFRNLAGLQHLTLNRLHLFAIHPDCFYGLDTLKALEMSYVKIDKENIYGNFLANVPMLEILKLKDSPTLVRYILSNHILAGMMNLKELNLQDNNLAALSVMVVTLPSLTALHLDGNQFNCDSNLLWLRHHYAFMPQIFPDYDKLRCHMPQHLQGQRIKDLADTDFVGTSQTNLPGQTTTEDPYYADYSSIPYYPYYDANYEDYYHHFDSTPYSKVETTPDSASSTSSSPSSSTTVSPSSKTTQTSLFSQTDNSTGLNVGASTHGAIKTTPAAIDSNSIHLKKVGIATGMSIGVIILMLLTAGIIYIVWRRRQNAVVHHNARQYPNQEYLFIASKSESVTTPNPKPRLTRQERGSTTSKASEDITNHADSFMPVYTLDVDA